MQEATGRPPEYATDGLFVDPDPVPALRELRDTGALAAGRPAHLTA